MITYYICFINNEYSIRGNIPFYECDTTTDSEKMKKFLNNLNEQQLEQLESISFDTDEDVTDACIYDIIETHRELALGIHPENSQVTNFDEFELTTIYIDMDNTIVKYAEMKNKMIDACPQMLFPQANFGFFSSLEPFDNAVRVIKRLMDNPKFEVMFATAPSIKNPMSYAEKRVSIENLFCLEACEALIIISKKNKLDDENVFLIDDMESGNGQDKFIKGQHLQFGNDDFPDWISIEKFFFA